MLARSDAPATALLAAGLLLVPVGPQAPRAPAQAPVSGPVSGDPVRWDAQTAEHLLNRAAFGATGAEVEAALRCEHAAFVELLLDGGVERAAAELDSGSEPDAAGGVAAFRREQRLLFKAHARWWFERMCTDEHPLRERMTLFWHGFFPSEYLEVKRGDLMVAQNELFREHALGNFGALLHAVVRDPAMIVYLDGDGSRAARLNENLGRELLERFSLGLDAFDERDVREAARALTGWEVHGDQAVFVPEAHDAGPKTILGRTACFDADGLVDLLLEQPACPRWVAGRLLRYLEGREPPAARVEDYAAFLREHDYELLPFLRRLFLDPGFYSPEVVGNRVASPVDFTVGLTRRLRLPTRLPILWDGAGRLGQRLFDPPGVGGWEGGRDWVGTSTLIARGNLAGRVLGLVAPDQGGRDDMERDRLAIDLRGLCADAGARADEELLSYLASELLAVPIAPASLASLRAYLAGQRADRALAPDGALLDDAQAEDLLRHLAYLILSLPEAQLN